MHFFFVIIGAAHGRNVDGRRHQLYDGVQHALNTFVLERRTAQHGLDFTGDGSGAQTKRNFLFGQIAFFKVFVHQLF